MIAQALNQLRAALPSGVQLVAVSKFHPVERLMEAYNAGQRIFGENRPQELAAKVPQMPADVQWHFIGHLQTNKLKLVLPYVTLVQSVDSFHLLEAISSWAVANGRVVDVLLELHLGAEETKQGFTEEEICSLLQVTRFYVAEDNLECSRSECFPSQVLKNVPTCDAGLRITPNCVAGQEKNEDLRRLVGIRVRGLMGMATNTDDMAIVEKDFERIERLFKQIKGMGMPDFDILSIGMSGDWPLAVKHGATMVRIGTDIFGPREY